MTNNIQAKIAERMSPTLGFPMVMSHFVGSVPHLFGDRVGDIYAIHNPYYSRLNRHILVAYRRTRGLAERTHDHFTGSRTKPIGHNDDIPSGLLVEIVRMNN